MGFLGAPVGRRLTTKAINKLLAMTEKQEARHFARVALLFSVLPPDLQAYITDASKSPVLTNSDRLRQYIAAREEAFGYQMLREILNLVKGVDVSPKQLSRMYEADTPEDTLAA